MPKGNLKHINGENIKSMYFITNDLCILFIYSINYITSCKEELDVELKNEDAKTF